jgi:serine/threonine protein kinase
MVVLNIVEASIPNLKGKIRVKILKLLGVGSYGRVYLTNFNNMVIKIFNNDQNMNIINLEYKIFKKLIDYTMPLENMKDLTESISNSYPINLVRALGIGELEEEYSYQDIINSKGSKFILMPLYQKFYDFHTELKQLHDFDFILKFITILLKVCIFLEKEMKIINMDIKTSNLMYDNKELILIDLGLVHTIEHGKEIYVSDNKYFVWPHDSCFLVAVPVYSIAICVIEFFFGKLKIWKISSNEDVHVLLNNINKRSEKIGNILYKMISLKYDPITILKYLEIKYLSNLNITDNELKIPDKIPDKKKTHIKKKKTAKDKLAPTVNKWYSNLLSTD